MKRRAVCLFVLVLWLLGVCTLLSLRIEDWMLLRVTAASPGESGLPLDCLYRDGEGDHLYRLHEGVGWEAGLTVREEYPGNYFVAPDTIRRVMPLEKYVRYATRQPTPGEKAEAVGKGETGDDVWLVLLSGEPPALPEGVTLLTREGSAALYAAADTPQIFMETRARSALGLMWEDVPIFSLRDAETALNALPALAATAALVLAAVVLWGWSCVLSRSARRRARYLLALNALLGLCALGAVFLLLRGLALPASLLPPENIFSWAHYRRELALLRPALRALSAAAPAGRILSLATGTGAVCLAIFAGAALGTAAVVLLQALLLRKGKNAPAH